MTHILDGYSLPEMTEPQSSALLGGLKRFCDQNPEALKARAMYDQRLEEHKKRFTPNG